MEPQPLRRQLLDWYDHHQRRLPWRATKDPWAIWVSEVMLQQTRVETAIPYYHRFMVRFSTPADLAAADIQEVLKMWEGLGYYSRARNLHRAAGLVAETHRGRVPDDPVAFRALPGVGDYICAAVLSIAFGRELPVVDGNVKRVLARLLEIKSPVNHSRAHKIFVEPAGLLISPDRPADFNQALMELGALVCRPKNPRCTDCPLADLCLAHGHGHTDRYPRRNATRPVPHRHLQIAVIRKADTLLVLQRPLEGFLGGMWEFPAVECTDQPPGAKFLAGIREATGLTIAIERSLGPIRHAYTHFTLSAEVLLCHHTDGRVRRHQAPAHRWVTPRALSRLALHKAVHKCLPALQKYWYTE